MSVRESLNSNKVMGFLVAALLLIVATVQAAYFVAHKAASKRHGDLLY